MHGYLERLLASKVHISGPSKLSSWVRNVLHKKMSGKTMVLKLLQSLERIVARVGPHPVSINTDHPRHSTCCLSVFSPFRKRIDRRGVVLSPSNWQCLNTRAEPPKQRIPVGPDSRPRQHTTAHLETRPVQVWNHLLCGSDRDGLRPRFISQAYL